MKIEVFRGFANSYLLEGYFLIDANNSKLPKVESVLITHEHCDHIVGLSSISPEKIYSSRFVSDCLATKDDGSCLCSPLGMKFPNKKTSHIVKDDDVVQQPEFSLKIIETPGHAKGAICAYLEKEKILFSGDTVFPDFAMPRLDLPTSEPEKLIKTYKKLEKLEIEIIYPGHGPKIEDKKYIKKLLEKIED